MPTDNRTRLEHLHHRALDQQTAEPFKALRGFGSAFGAKPTLILVTLILSAVFTITAWSISKASAASSSRIVELKHDVSVVILDGTARLAVERRFRIGGTDMAPATISFYLPGAASFENAQLDWGKGWQPLRTLTRAEADRAFKDRLTKSQSKPSSVSGPTVPIVLRQSGREKVVLEAAMVRPGTVLSIRYNLVAPTCNASGRNSVGYPYQAYRVGKNGDRMRPTFHGNAQIAPPGETLVKERGDLTQQACHGSHGGARGVLVASVPSSPTLDVRWASIETARHTLSRLEVDLPEIADPPSEASVVFVLDGSFSMADKGLRHQLSVVRSLASQFPDGKFQVVIYSRAGRAMFPTFVNAANFERVVKGLSKKSRALANGSNIESGLETAAQLLVGRASPQRVIAFSDNLLRRRFSVAEAIASLGPIDKDAVVHLVDFAPSSTALSEDSRKKQRPAHRFAPIGQAFGGIVMKLKGRVQNRQHAEPVLKHLVVPTRLDQFVATAAGGVSVIRDSVPLGTGLRAFGRQASAARKQERTDQPRGPGEQARVAGLLWSTPIGASSARSVSLQRDLESLVVGDAIHSLVRPRELRAIALRLEAVSRETSQFWAGSQVTEHIEPGGFGFGSTGTGYG